MCRNSVLTSVLAALLLAALSACAPAELPVEEPPTLTVILGARLIDGSESPPLDDSVIVIERTRIRAVGTRASTPVPKGAEIIDAAGKTVIPGLIDLHCHYHPYGDQAERAFGAQLAFGVTTARSIGVDDDELLAAIERARSGKTPAPRILTAGLGFTHPEGHPIALDFVRRPASADEARQGVRELAAQKVDFIKMWVESKYSTLPKIAPEIRAAIVEEARKRGIPVVAHIFEEADVNQLIELGVNDFLHTVRDTEPMDDDFLKLCRDHGVSFAATLTVIERNWYYAQVPEALEADPEALAAMSPAALAQVRSEEWRKQALADPLLPRLKAELARAQRFVKQMHEAGVHVTLGSDSGAGAIPTGWGTHNEMRLLVEAGLSPLEVIRIATAGNARRLGAKGADIGRLQAGKIADLILLTADPSQDIENSRRIERVMKGGEWVDRRALLGQ